jgi:Carboxypeptidase regulatory-like domain
MRQLRTLLIFLAFGALGHTQTFRGAINGRVMDPSGAVVPAARVVGEDTATGIEHTTVTTSDGQFAFQDLPLGTYQVTITASGFAVSTTDNIAVSAGTIYTLPVKLVLAQSSFTVEVCRLT